MSKQSETNQLSPDLPSTTTYLTGHNEEGKAKVHSARPAAWKPFEGGVMGFNQIYTNTFPADLNNDADVKYHEEIISSGKLGLATKNGVVCRMVDFGPHYECMMHRTQSLDFGIVVEGEIEMKLDDGSKTLMKRGDVAVQRATMHSWRNTSPTNWARMIFVLQDMKPLFVNGKKFGEDLGGEVEGLPPSGNDEE
ncbi:uncharacterized protein F4807DRAFT_144225 [Annulohypoxylon truncatum]|uniref:uncharacterized protein n=1 Tax=Annulohypoxylon truncatum TaxID=327061 RepID=UPI0020076680|nr:uncharacterized protein F4807DRAFT_144225 [Annulohypoxylon truncatum]KAI1208638.1 hypothetical protein F4807DRAFT_144225 [Annulohypoxylon truncatum]